MKTSYLSPLTSFLLSCLLLSCLLISCKPKEKITVRTTTNTNTEITVKKDSTVKKDIRTDARTMLTLDEIELITSDYDELLKIYDTTQPIDISTGKPPLKEERIITRRKRTDTTRKLTDKSDTSTTDKSSIKVKTDTKAKEKTQQTTKQTPIDPLVYWKIILVLVLFIALVYLARRWVNQIKEEE